MMIKRGIMILCMIFAVLLISLYVSAGNIIVKNGELNVSSDFFVDTNSLFVNSTSGNVGIGTTGPATPLEINRASDGAILKLTRQAVASWDFGIRNTPTVAGLQAGSLEILPQNGNTDFSIGSQIFPAALVVKNSGNVGIGTTSPDYQLELSLNSAGKPTSNVWTVVSDERIKTNISDFEDGLDKIMNIRPVTYNYNGLGGLGYDDNEAHIGIIAQELELVTPYMVETRTGMIGNETVDDFKAYQGHALPFILVNAIKQQQGQIQELKAENNALKLQNQEIFDRLELLENS